MHQTEVVSVAIRLGYCMLITKLRTAYLMYVEVMAATVGVCPVDNKIGFTKKSRTEMGMHSNPRMIMARCHT